MSRVRGRNTTPELKVRRVAHALGLRFRLHCKGLPGTPDLVFSRWRVALFVHGCFWHRHEGCKKATNPKSREDFWRAKFERNVERDKRAIHELQARGWQALVIWQCETTDRETLKNLIARFFDLASDPES